MMQKIFLFLCIVALGVGITFWSLLQPVNSADKSQVIFVVPKGSSVRDISQKLADEHLIKNTTLFLLITKFTHLDAKLQAGDFKLSPSMTPQQIAESLTSGAIDVWVTFPEGERATEIDNRLQAALPESYRGDWKDQLIAHEGYLFPDTYLFPKDVTIDLIITTMTNNFEKKYAEAIQQQTVSLTRSDAIKIASIVEREAQTPEDMRGVASVLENRLKIGMMLGSDVTVEYALGYDPAGHTWWKQDLTADDLAIKSPFNTRSNAGLPPTPICNPGLVAIEAALNPTKTNYLYFIADKNGKVHFATTLEQHNANVAKYL